MQTSRPVVQVRRNLQQLARFNPARPDYRRTIRATEALIDWARAAGLLRDESDYLNFRIGNVDVEIGRYGISLFRDNLTLIVDLTGADKPGFPATLTVRDTDRVITVHWNTSLRWWRR